jgi:hypothetical protein
LLLFTSCFPGLSLNLFGSELSAFRLQQMQHWQGTPDLAGVRGPKALSRLPEVERPEWQKLWEAVSALQKRAAGPR